MRFEVKAMRDGGAVTRLALDASDEADAARLAKAQGYAVLSVRSLQPLRALGRRRQQFPLGMFAQELLTLLEAGLAVVESLETLREKESHPDRAQVLARIVAGLYEGQPLSQTLAAQPEVFPPLFVATVRASEKTSDLPEAFRRYVAYQGQLDVVKKKLVSAAIYPFLLLGVGSLVVAFLLLYVVPRFSRIFEDMGTNIPALAKLLTRRGIPGVFLDLEPHLKGGGQFGGYSGPDGFGVALRSLTRVLDYVGISYHLRDFDDVRASRGL